MTTIKAGTTTTTSFSIEQDTTGDLVFQAGSNTPLTIANTGQVNIANTAAFKVPVGGVNDRPATPANGMLRYNSDFEEFEGYSNSKWNLLTLGSMKLKLDFDQTTTLPTGISFTRATNGTFFNSSGVLTTAGSGVARFDHRLESGSWVNKGLLIEEQRTNQLQRSAEFDNAYWTKTNVTVTANAVTAPDGTTTADSGLETTTNGNHSFYSGNYSASNTTLSGSVFVKPNGRTRIKLQISNFVNSTSEVTINLTANTVTTSSSGSDYTNISGSITEVGNGFYRVTISATKGNVNTNNRFFIEFVNDSGSVSYAGDTSKGFYLWGAQLEAGAFPTSYIATTSASVTRNADQATMTSTNFSSWFNQPEGTIFTQYDFIGPSTFNFAWDITENGTNVDRHVFTTINNSITSRVVAIDGGVTQAILLSPDPTITPVANTTYKHAYAYKVNDFAATLDGRSPATDTSGTVPTPNRIELGQDRNNLGLNSLNGHLAKFYYWNTRKPNSFLQSITG